MILWYIIIAVGVTLNLLAFLVGGNETGAVPAPEIEFEGGFHAGFAHGGVPGIIGVQGILQILGVQGTNRAQNVGSVLGVIFPDGGGFHVHARGAQLHDGGKVFVAGVSDEHIVGKVGQVAQRKLIADADDQTGFFIRPGFGDLVTLTQLLDQHGSGNI